ncbi:MAG: glycosyltransferase family 2 protein [Bacillota bacterium]|nr:glycosyltransferase family 2 protein [Bacillota bacterium]
MDNKIAVILPVYNEEGAIHEHFKEIRAQMISDGIEAHFLFVDDGSKDGTWDELCRIAEEYENIEAVKFSRNFGKEMAIRAGLSSIDADYYVVMDSDLQHPPRHIAPMIALMKEKQVDIVNGKKASRGKEGLVYKFFARSFYGLMHSLSGVDMRGTSDFKVFSKKVAEEIRKFGEQGGFFRGFIDWVGFSCVDYHFDVEERRAGKTSFSFGKLVRLAIGAIVGYSSKPLMLTIYIGTVFLGFAMLLGIHTLVNFFTGHAISGFSTVILLQLIIGSCVLICLGLIGIYVAKIYEEVKGRPPYILEKRIESASREKRPVSEE